MLLAVTQSGEPFDRERWLGDRRRPGEPPPAPPVGDGADSAPQPDAA
jgi:hypothetical protein